MANYVERSKNLLNIKGRTEAPYNSSVGVNTNIRNFSEDYFYVGLTANNYWYNWNVEEFFVEENEVKVKPKINAYGVTFPVRCKPSTKYKLSYIETNGKYTVGYYTENGVWISYEDGDSIALGNYGIIVTPANCYWLTICITAKDVSQMATYTDIMLNEGKVALPYEPYGARVFIGNNLFNINGGYFANTVWTEPHIKVENNKLINTDVLDGASSWVIFNKEYPAGTYTICMSVETNDTSNAKDTYRFGTSTENNVGTYLEYYKAWYKDVQAGTPITFTTTKPFEISIFFCGNADSYRAYYDIMLNKGDTALPYEPYKAEPFKKVRVAYYKGKRIFLDRNFFGVSGSSTLASLARFKLSDLSRMKLR